MKFIEFKSTDTGGFEFSLFINPEFLQAFGPNDNKVAMYMGQGTMFIVNHSIEEVRLKLHYVEPDNHRRNY
jgi:hypothetical protein